MTNDAWDALDKAERFAIALAVARRRGKEWISAYGNVVGLGAGFRLRGEGQDLQDEVCLRFLVSRKWHDRRHRAQKIPDAVIAYPMREGRRVRVRIPTDVSEFRGGSPHAALNLTAGIMSRHQGQPQDFGSACCVVRNTAQPNERYLLSCYHVFSSFLESPPRAGLDCIGDNQVNIGPISEAASPDGAQAVDAALVRFEHAAADGVVVWDCRPTWRATDSDLHQLTPLSPLFVLGRRVAPASGGRPSQTRNGPLPASFSAVFVDPMPFDYRTTAGRYFHFADTIEYKAAVRPGDSGAALVGADGILYGMHFYGRGEFGYALSAPRLFDPGVFSFSVEL